LGRVTLDWVVLRYVGLDCVWLVEIRLGHFKLGCVGLVRFRPVLFILVWVVLS
jgi:hypothetical protein